MLHARGCSADRHSSPRALHSTLTLQKSAVVQLQWLTIQEWTKKTSERQSVSHRFCGKADAPHVADTLVSFEAKEHMYLLVHEEPLPYRLLRPPKLSRPKQNLQKPTALLRSLLSSQPHLPKAKQHLLRLPSL